MVWSKVRGTMDAYSLTFIKVKSVRSHLCPVFLLGRHIDVIDEEHNALVDWGAIPLRCKTENCYARIRVVCILWITNVWITVFK